MRSGRDVPRPGGPDGVRRHARTRVGVVQLDDFQHIARAIGLRPGDTLIAINGRTVGPLQIHGVVERSKGAPLTLTVVRHGRRVALGPVQARKEASYSVPHAVWDERFLLL